MLRIRGMLTLTILAVTASLAACDDDDEDLAGPDTTVTYSQIERMGLPAVATVFIPTSKKDAYNQAAPSGDRAAFRGDVIAVLTAFGHSASSANGLADALLPDILSIDTSKPTAFLNGRGLSDDVITGELMLIFGSNASLNDDHVDRNDRQFSNTFPYLAPPAGQ